TAQQAAPTSAPERIRIGWNVAEANLIHSVDPVYPAIAVAAHVQGIVILHVVIGKDGDVKDIQFVSGPPLLMRAALNAVRQWVYKPTLLNGQAVEVDTTVSVYFAMDGDRPAGHDKIDQSISSDIYRNGTAKFSLIIPDGWTTSSGIAHVPNGIGGLVAPDVRANLLIQRFRTTKNPVAFERTVDAHGPGTFAGYQKIGESVVTVQGKTCQVLTFRANGPPFASEAAGQTGIRRTVVFVPSEKYVIALTFSTPESRADSEDAVFEKIASSFQSTADSDAKPKQ
ncbi:MAG: TonB family protein, partial [Candidatus Acidiferrales bacterium]